MLAPSSIVTSPMIAAFGAMKAPSAIRGRVPCHSTIMRPPENPIGRIPHIPGTGGCPQIASRFVNTSLSTYFAKQFAKHVDGDDSMNRERRQYVRFAFYKADSEWRRLAAIDREAA